MDVSRSGVRASSAGGVVRIDVPRRFLQDVAGFDFYLVSGDSFDDEDNAIDLAPNGDAVVEVHARQQAAGASRRRHAEGHSGAPERRKAFCRHGSGAALGHGAPDHLRLGGLYGSRLGPCPARARAGVGRLSSLHSVRSCRRLGRAARDDDRAVRRRVRRRPVHVRREALARPLRVVGTTVSAQ